MQLGITVKHHDHAYAESRGGVELLTHLGGASARAGYRRDALDRAFAGYGEAVAEGRPAAEVGGLGLVVLQRSLLIAEDLGGLLHGFSEADPWTALRGTSIPDLDAAYSRAASQTAEVLSEAFRVVTEEELLDEGVSAAEAAALGRLRVRLMTRWHMMLVRATGLWLAHRDIAKATMHAFPVIAGEHVLGPPPAGTLARRVRPYRGRWVLAVTSRESHKEVNTVQTVVPVDDEHVTRYRREGRSTARLYVELADVQSRSIMSGHKAGIPMGLVNPASDDDEALITEALARLGSDDG